MRLIVPMAGTGARFRAAGFTAPKPLIEVDGKPMIAHVLEMFPGMEDPLFICRRDHLRDTAMENILRALKPRGEIFAVEHALGPVDAVMQAVSKISDSDEALISYCDYFMRWDFLAFCASKKPAGCVPCYTGFHPHLIPAKNLYASCRVEGENLLEIREKHSFTADKTQSRHSPGVYYFDSGARLKKYAKQMMAARDMLNGEYYASMIYPYMLRDGLQVSAPANVEFFCQWGTPEDLRDYEYWTRLIDGWRA